MEERRIEHRLLCADLVRVDWNDRTFEGVLEDISPRGACVQVEEPIPPNEVVSISVIGGGSPLFTGRVTYCAYRDCGHFVGIHFTGPAAWTSGVYEPRHLTDVEALTVGS